nr:tRNA (adenosine(37)-N6)-threonylcarbamoyltransferase complex dimerization subunit type 1 TsaB [uncultured Carboxylicivirga sp.]
MARILSIETSTGVCSVAYSVDGKVVDSKELFEANSHAAHLTVLIDQLLSENNLTASTDLDAVAVSSGPGSYTGLRIGVSTAKGICFAADLPLIAIDSLHIMSYPVINKEWKKQSTPYLFCPLMDARRMEVYTALFDSEMNLKEKISAKIIDEDTFAPLLTNNTVVFYGNGAQKCKEVINHSNAIFIDDAHPLAKNLAPMAEEHFNQNKFEDVAYFEPFYLKDFVATTPKKKVL